VRIAQDPLFSRPRLLRHSAELLASRVELHDQLTMRKKCIEALLGSEAPSGLEECEFGFVGELRFHGVKCSASLAHVAAGASDRTGSPTFATH